MRPMHGGKASLVRALLADGAFQHMADLEATVLAHRAAFQAVEGLPSITGTAFTAGSFWHLCFAFSASQASLVGVKGLLHGSLFSSSQVELPAEALVSC